MNTTTETDALPEPLARSIETRLVEGKLELPVLPQIAGEVMDLCGSETTDAAGLSALLHRDQALATNVLRVANSPAYMPAVPIASLQQAVSRLGLRQVAEIAVAVSVRARLFQAGDHDALLRALWRHSVAAGFFAKEIARIRRRNVETAFLCGLLHDVGKPVLLANLPNLKGDGNSLDAETVAAVLDHFHTRAGGILADRWQLPAQICEAIQHHHDYIAAQEHRESAMMACLADMMAHLVLPGVVVVVEEDLREHPVLEALNLYQDQFEHLIAAADSVREMVEAVA